MKVSEMQVADLEKATSLLEQRKKWTALPDAGGLKVAALELYDDKNWHTVLSNTQPAPTIGLSDQVSSLLLQAYTDGVSATVKDLEGQLTALGITNFDEPFEPEEPVEPEEPANE